MPRYYLDIREGDDFDAEGLELPTVERVQEEAARSLADMARDAVRSDREGAGHEMAVEVRDDAGPVLQVKFTFEIDRHRQQAVCPGPPWRVEGSRLILKMLRGTAS